MGNHIPEENVAKHTQYGSNLNVEYFTMQMKGWRKQMQDATLHQLNIDKKSLGEDEISNSLFAVFDGHGTSYISRFLKENFVDVLINLDSYKSQNYFQALEITFKLLDQMMLTEKGQSMLKKIKQEEDEIQLQSKNHPVGQKIGYYCGSTANVVLITKDHYYIANCGDSRSVLCRSGYAIVLSKDHKPINSAQYDRIKKAKGYVMDHRVNQILSVSRAFGDFQLKKNKQLPYDQQIITCKADVNVYGKSKRDDFILIACDGIWENYDETKLLVNEIQADQDYKKGQYSQTLTKLFDRLIAKNQKETLGRDNMTAILLKPKNDDRQSSDSKRKTV